VNHSTPGLVAVHAHARALVDFQRLPVDVLRAAQREVQHAGADGLVAQPVDDDEAAHVAVLRVGVERDRAIEREHAHAGLVELQRLGGEVLERVDVDQVLRRGDRGAERARAELDQVRAARQQRLLAHPDHVRLELVGEAGRIVGGADHVAAADVDLVGEGQRDGLAVRRPRAGRRRS
jgi:hypothetical protein